MNISMTQEELEDFFSKPLLARIATCRNFPHIAPVWFIYENGEVIISTGRDSTKIKNIRNNPRVALVVDTSEGGLQSRGVIFRGKAELIDKDTLETTKKIYRKYLGSLEHSMVKQLLQMPRIIIKFKPQKTISWDYSKMR